LKDQEAKKAEQDAKKAEKENEPSISGKLHVEVIQARNLLNMDPFNGKSDPYVEVKMNKNIKQIMKTKVIDNEPNPVWNFNDNFDVVLKESDVTGINVMFTVFDKDLDADDFLGYKEINVDALFKESGSWINEIYQL